MPGTYSGPGKKFKGQDDAPDETPSAKKPTPAPTPEAAPAAAAPAKEEPRQSAVTNSAGQIALAGSSVDPAYEKAKEARRRNRGAQAKALGNF